MAAVGRAERHGATEVAVQSVEETEGQRRDQCPADKHSAGYQALDEQLTRGQKKLVVAKEGGTVPVAPGKAGKTQAKGSLPQEAGHHSGE